MLHYFDVYAENGLWVGAYDDEDRAKKIATDYNGYYNEVIEYLEF